VNEEKYDMPYLDFIFNKDMTFCWGAIKSEGRQAIGVRPAICSLKAVIFF
jgi:hypothetical protein